jgi:hypothetical protein
LAGLNGALKEKDLESLKENNNVAIMRAGAEHAEAITFGTDKPDKNCLKSSVRCVERKICPIIQSLI